MLQIIHFHVNLWHDFLVHHQKEIPIIRRKYNRIRSELNERSERLWAAAEAMELGWGGVSAVAIATKMARDRIQRGVQELQGSKRKRKVLDGDRYRVRCVGGGRKNATQKDLQLLSALLALVEPDARGDPESPLRWTIKSTRELARELKNQKHWISHSTVATLLYEAEFSLQGAILIAMPNLNLLMNRSRVSSSAINPLFQLTRKKRACW